MFNTLKELPLRAFVRMQTGATAASERSRASLIPTTTRDRSSLALGGIFATAAYAASVPALAANSGTGSFLNVLSTFTKFALIIVGAVSILMAVAAGLMFITSGGNSRMISRAKDTIKYVVLGMMLVGGLWVLRRVLGAVVDPGGQDSLNKQMINGADQAAQDAAGAKLK